VHWEKGLAEVFWAETLCPRYSTAAKSDQPIRSLRSCTRTSTDFKSLTLLRSCKTSFRMRPDAIGATFGRSPCYLWEKFLKIPRQP
jgi:hypothetical protein